MKISKPVRWLLVLKILMPQFLYAQTSDDSLVLLKNLSAFEQSVKGWSDVSDIIYNPNKSSSLKKLPGEGVIIFDAGKTQGELISHEKFGDMEMEFDFLVGKNAIASLLIQGRYRLNLSDSWSAENASSAGMGYVSSEGTTAQNSFSGAAPLLNVAKAPGLWQHVKLRFRVPKYLNGNRSANAYLEEVYFNNCLIQQNLELQGSIGTLQSTDDKGPIVFNDTRGILALKNITVRRIGPAVLTRNTRPTGRRFNRVTNPIILTPDENNYLLRSFLNFGNKKRTHVISVGNLKEVNYSYDLKQGALLQVWRGPFVDVTEMWEQRGEPQLARPLGSVIPLSENPALAILSSPDAAWPDSIAFDDFRTMGYTLDKQRNPSFEYETSGYHVNDKIYLENETRSLRREFIVTDIPANLYCRVANNSVINSLGKGLYVVGDKSYYIQIDEKIKPLLRNTSRGVELLLPVTKDKQVSYSMIW